MKKRATITDIARAAGLSKGAVSHALNGRRGVSEETRARVLAIAESLDWTPSSVARALTGSRTGAVGWVIRRSAKSSSIDPYFMQLFIGIELELASTEYSLVVKFVATAEEELDVYRRWSAERRVDGIVLGDLRNDDERVSFVEDLGLRLVTGAPGSISPAPGALTIDLDERSTVIHLVDELVSRGHRRIGWIGGPADHEATLARWSALEAATAAHGATVMVAVTDFSASSGADAAVEMLDGGPRPSVLVVDNELMAHATIAALTERGIAVPGDISIVSWLDSDLCRLASPPIAAIRHDIVGFGRDLARLLVAAVEGRDTGVEAVRSRDTPELVVRESLRSI